MTSEVSKVLNMRMIQLLYW